ncbi:glycosyl hydrolase family 18 protein, partial [Streptosporangium algeriense]
MAEVNLKAMTWNLYGKEAPLKAVPRLMGEHDVAVAALQEVVNGDLLGLTASRPSVARFTARGTTWATTNVQIEQYTLDGTGDSAPVRGTAFVLRTGRENRGIALITTKDVDDVSADVHIIDVRPDADGEAFPALGVKLDDVWYYSIHASTQAKRAENNAETLVQDIAGLQDFLARGGDWAAMGDWNRFAAEDSSAYRTQRSKASKGVRSRFLSDQEPLEGAIFNSDIAVIHSGGLTHRQGAELDYMVAKGAGDGYKAKRAKSRGKSDHYPVFFGDDGSSDPDTCMGDAAPAANALRAADETCPLDEGVARAAVSMGDSYISGEGGRWQGNANTSGGDSWGTDRAADGTQVYDGGSACHRSDVAEIKSADIGGPPTDWERIPKERMFNIACSGAETEHILTDDFKGEKPQLEQLADLAERYELNTIVVSIGGNDLEFSSIVETCGKNFMLNKSACAEQADKDLTGRMGGVRRAVSKVLDGIRDVLIEAGQDVTGYNLVLQSYPSPLPAPEDVRYPGDHYDRYLQGGCPFYDEDLKWTRTGAIKKIGDMLRGVAQDKEALFLDLANAFAGHELCSKSARQARSGETLTTPIPADEAEWIRFVDGPTTSGERVEDIHPNAYGQQALGQCLSLALIQMEESPGQMYFPCVGTPGTGPYGSSVTLSPIDDAVETADGWRGDGARLGDHYIFQGGKYARFNPDANMNGSLDPDGKIKYGQTDGWLGAVRDTGDNWPSLDGTPFADGVDAVFEASTDKHQLMFLRGDRFARVEMEKGTADDTRVKGPMPIRDHFETLRDTAWDNTLDAAVGNARNQMLIFRKGAVGLMQVSMDDRKDTWIKEPKYAEDVFPVLKNTPFADRVDAALLRHQQTDAMWVDLISGTQVVTLKVDLNDLSRSTLATSVVSLTTMWPSLRGTVFDWEGGSRRPDKLNIKMSAGSPYDEGSDGRQAKPSVSGPHPRCRPEGLAETRDVDTPYCEVYDADGREWLGGDGHDRRVVGYFTGWRTGENSQPRYLVPNIPWSKVTHINYAFAKVDGGRISIGDTGDPRNPAVGLTWSDTLGAQIDGSLPYKGHFNLLARYKRKHPQVKVLISVGGWADTRNFYAMATNADGSVNQPGIDTFADSVTDFLDRYGAAFDGVDIDYEYPSALPKAGNPADWDLSDPRRKGLQAGYNALMKTLREKLDRAGADRGRYYLLTAAASASGYLVRGYDAGQALRYLDFVNLMTYDMHGSWNNFVGPQAPLYDDGRDNELEAAKFYSTKEYDKTGYFNVDWAYHYYRGALPPGRINIGIPYYTRGWQNVTGGDDGLWGTSSLPDQGQCQPGTGPGSGSSTPSSCGNGAEGIDNIWHDLGGAGQEVASGSNPMWHAKNLQEGKVPGYLRAYTNPNSEAAKLKGTYEEKYDDALRASWLWNPDKKVFLSTENDTSLDAKIEYVRDNKLGGVMMWELAGDYAKDDDGEYGMGYDMTTRLDDGLRDAGGYQTTRAGGTTPPDEVVDVRVEFVDHPTEKDPTSGDDPFYPMRPKLRVSNETDTTLPAGTEISFDIPTSAPPLLKDENYQEFGGELVVDKGREGANVGGLGADFHRVTLKLGYCEDLAPGAVRDIVLRHYLPLTGPANVTVKTGSHTYGSTQDGRQGTTTVTPDVPDGVDCQAEQWQPHPYNPHGTFAFDKDDDDWRIVDWVGGNVLDHPADWDTAYLVENQPGNENQLWTVDEDGGAGWYRIKSRGKCLQADGILKSLSVHDCDGEPHQWWQLRVMKAGEEDVVVTGTPATGTGYQLVSFADEEYEPAYVAEGKNSGDTPGTALVAGDPDGTTASTVIWDGFYWRTGWWTTVTDEPGKSDAWRKLGPVSDASPVRRLAPGAAKPRAGA